MSATLTLGDDVADWIAPYAHRPPTALEKKLRDLRRRFLRRYLHRPVDAVARWLGLWDRTWSQEQFEVTFLEWLGVRVPRALTAWWDERFWLHAFEHECARYAHETGGEAPYIGSGSDVGAYGINMSWRDRCHALWEYEVFERARALGLEHLLGYEEC